MNWKAFAGTRTISAAGGLALLLLLALALLLWARSQAEAHPAADIVVGVPVQVAQQGWINEELTAQDSAEAGGTAVLSGDFYDFGRVRGDTAVEREFMLINRGSDPLVLRSAHTTCGCTRAELSASVIPPGRAARVRVTFDAGYHNVTGMTVRRGLVLETSDPTRPLIEIWVQARVE